MIVYGIRDKKNRLADRSLKGGGRREIMDSEVKAMKKKSAEDVLKNTFEHIDRIVDEKKAEKDAQTHRGRDADRSKRKKRAVNDEGKTRMAAALA